MKNLFSTVCSWFSPKKYEPSEVDMLRLEYETRIQSLEQDVRRLCTMLNHDQVSVTTSKETLKAHFDAVVSESVMKWLGNWADDKFVSNDNLDDAVSDCISNGSFISDNLDNEDWDYRLRDCLDWDKVADKVVDKIDWSDVVSNNDIITREDLDTDDIMFKSEHMSDDDLVTRENLSDMVCDELKRDWFVSKLSEDVSRIFKQTLQNARENEEANCRNAIDDAIEAKLDLLLVEQLKSKFGPQFDLWFHNLVAHSVKTVLGEMVKAAYEEVTTSEGNSNV
jgi:hypothetical protein